MLKLNNILCIETYGDKSKVVNPNAANLPKLKARNSIYLKLQEVEKKYKNE